MSAVLVQGHCYTELAVSSLVVANTIYSTHCAYPQRDGQAELVWVAFVKCYTRERSPIPVSTEPGVEQLR